MKTITRNVNEIGPEDRLALEHVIGAPLAGNEQIIINVLNVDPPERVMANTSPGNQEVPAWWNVYEGLEAAEVDRLDAAIRQRANLTRAFE